MPTLRLLVIGAIWLSVTGVLYVPADPYLQADLAKVAGMMAAMAVAWLPVRPLYRRWN